MTQQTICELAILFLLALASFRVFLIKDPSSDPLAVLPLVAFIMSLLSFFAWGINIQEIAVASVALFVTIWNFRALLRLQENLIVDHFSFLFVLSSLISLILISVTVLLILYFMPKPASLKKYGVTKTVQQYSGNLEKSFSKTESSGNIKTAVLYCYEKKNNTEKNPVILFVPTECSSTFIYEPLLVKLAHDGYSVYSADFSLKPKRSFLIRMRLSKPEIYEKWKADEKNERDLYMCRAILAMAQPKKEDFAIILGDCIDSRLLMDLKKEDSRIDACFDVSSIDSYTEKGYGPVEQTDPITAFLIGRKKDFSMYASNHTAVLLEQMIDQSIQVSDSSQE